jgi:hypothetical protein
MPDAREERMREEFDEFQRIIGPDTPFDYWKTAYAKGRLAQREEDAATCMDLAKRSTTIGRELFEAAAAAIRGKA